MRFMHVSDLQCRTEADTERVRWADPGGAHTVRNPSGGPGGGWARPRRGCSLVRLPNTCPMSELEEVDWKHRLDQKRIRARWDTGQASGKLRNVGNTRLL